LPVDLRNRRAENAVVYATGLVQGIVLVTFPAASTILTATSGYGLSPTLYGVLFLPQVAAAIVAALLGGRLTARFGTKRVYLAGLAASLVSMVVLALSQFVESDHALAYPMLLLATASLGAGFGLTVPALNTLTGAFHPRFIDRSVLVLNALLGLGTALAPVFVAIFLGLGVWWGLPVLSSVLLVVLFAAALGLPLSTTAERTIPPGGDARVPRRFWLYAGIAVLYGVIETMSGNWSQLFMTSDLRVTGVAASVALTAFWTSVTVGRIGFAALQRVFPTRWIYRVIPLVVAGAYLAVLMLSPGSAVGGIVAFAVAGIGCSALLPLTLSFGEVELTSMSTSVAGRLIAFYQIGYGIAAFGVGPLVATGTPLASVFGLAAVVAVLTAIAALAITMRSTPRAAA
jgi:MFS family permease